VVELARSRRCLVQGNEITDVLSRLADDAGIIRVLWYFVPRDNCHRIQGLKLVERGNPLKPAMPVGLAEKGMNSIVDGIAGSDGMILCENGSHRKVFRDCSLWP
jgi:hypothetical protein